MHNMPKLLKILGAILLAALLACLIFCAVYPKRDAVIVRYRASDITVPMKVEHVERMERYFLEGKLYQLIVYERDKLVPIVFTPFDLVGYRRSLISAIPVQDFHDTVYHTYDPMLQEIKYGLRKVFINEKYEEYFGRPPTEYEYYFEMDKLVQKVQLEQLDERLVHYPEAIYHTIESIPSGRPLHWPEKLLIRCFLRCGASPQWILQTLRPTTGNGYPLRCHGTLA